MKPAALGLLLAAAAPAWTMDLRDGDVVLYRHALAPGGGDPPGMTLADCSTQRNLSDEGRAQARRMGESLRQRLGALKVTAVWASPWCRTLDTARLAFGSVPLQVQPAFASFFADPAREAELLQQARTQLSSWRGPGVLVIVTHQVTVTGLSGVYPASGEGVAMRWNAAAPQLLGSLAAP